MGLTDRSLVPSSSADIGHLDDLLTRRIDAWFTSFGNNTHPVTEQLLSNLSQRVLSRMETDNKINSGMINHIQQLTNNEVNDKLAMVNSRLDVLIKDKTKQLENDSGEIFKNKFKDAENNVVKDMDVKLSQALHKLVPAEVRALCPDDVSKRQVLSVRAKENLSMLTPKVKKLNFKINVLKVCEMILYSVSMMIMTIIVVMESVVSHNHIRVSDSFNLRVSVVLGMMEIFLTLGLTYIQVMKNKFLTKKEEWTSSIDSSRSILAVIGNDDVGRYIVRRRNKRDVSIDMI